MTYRLGLTGSIGMGKSTTAKLFAEFGCDVWDADAAVHRMYDVGGKAVSPMQDVFPAAVIDGKVSRNVLKNIIANDPAALKKIEGIVHPMVAEDRAEFVASARSDILVFDIPLLFETGGNARMDGVVCVTISPEIQEKRVLERGSMTKQQFEMIEAKQMPISEKCALSDYVITTDTIENARALVSGILAAIRKQIDNA